MKDFVLLIAAITLWAIVWRVLAKHWRSKGWSGLISHVSAGLSGFVVSVIALCLLLPGKSEQEPAAVPPDASEAGRATLAHSDEASGADSQKSVSVPPMPTVFTGAASEGAVTADNWPTAITLTLKQSDDEKRYLADQTCLDETACYGPKRFKQYILKRYPDLARVRYHPLPEEADDSEIVTNRRESFFQSLFFAKQIQLANGQNLYDFMVSCSKGLTPLDAAEVAYDDKVKGSYFDIQYFPTLRRIDTGEPVELQILFERRGDKLIARSPFFTSNALQYPDFLTRHRVTCWHRGAAAT